MGDAIHGAVGLGFAGEFVVGGDEVFGKAGFPGKGTLVAFGFGKGKGPVHGGEVEPMVGPAKELLRVGIDKLREEDPVKGGVLADKDRLFAPYTPLGEDIDDLLRNVAGSATGRNFLPGKAIDPKTLLI